MPMKRVDPETGVMKQYYTEGEVEKLVGEVIDEAEEWAGEDIRVVSNRILFEHGFKTTR